MVNSSFYNAFERMWTHVLSIFDNYVTNEVLDEHITDKDNPHGITAEQVGVYTKEEVDNKLSLAGEVKILDSDDNVTGIIEVPVLRVERVNDGTKITATDNNGLTTSMVYDGRVAFEDLTEEQKGSLKGEPGYSPVYGIDYWTEKDIADMKAYFDEVILGGAW